MRDLKIETGGTKNVSLSEEDRELTADELSAVVGGAKKDEGCRAVMKFSENDSWIIQSDGTGYVVRHEHGTV